MRPTPGWVINRTTSGRFIATACSFHDPRTHLHQPMPVPKQLPQITILRTGYPDSRKAIFQQQLQQKFGIEAIGFLLADSQSLDLCRIADPHLETQLCQ